MTYPVLFEWDGDAMVPRKGYRKRCDEEYVVGEVYRLEVREERSWKSHQHYFACIRDTWQNLPDELAEQIPTAEHLRKYALIKAGYRDQRSIATATPEEAKRLQAMVQSFDDYAIVTVSDNVVTIHTAKSQSIRAMGKSDFQRSKDAVLNILAGLIDVDRATLENNAGGSA